VCYLFRSHTRQQGKRKWDSRKRSSGTEFNRHPTRIKPVAQDSTDSKTKFSPFSPLPSVQRIWDQICASVGPVSQEATEVTEIGLRKRKFRDGIQTPSSAEGQTDSSRTQTDSKTKFSVSSVTSCSTLFSESFEPLAPVV
jgi:hypothetical protein